MVKSVIDIDIQAKNMLMTYVFMCFAVPRVFFAKDIFLLRPSSCVSR